ncbi:MAG: PBP1A family penicillin-binding protein [Desulfosalsimonas sp.]
MIKKLVVGLGLILILVFVLSFGYCWYLSGNIEERFAGRRWAIPSTIYSDTTMLFPGRRVNVSTVEKKLKKLGYQEKEGALEKKGEYRVIDSGMEIYFKDLDVPDEKRRGFEAVLDIDQGKIGGIRRAGTDETLPLVELGPEVLMQFFGKERELRRVVSIKNIPGHLADAVLAAEDNRFYSHLGIDPIGILRAVYTNIRNLSIRQGGSTLTQQLAKNYFLTPERTFKRKFHELFITLAIEANYSKDEILEIYLNEIYLGQKGSASINGVGEAAYFYFGKTVDNLTLSESALIAGIIKAPNLFSPYTHAEECKDRRDQVLRAMHDQEFITEAQLERAIEEPVKTVGFEKYSRRAPYFLDYVSRQLGELYPEDILSSMGFSIYTTLDTGVQAAAENALEKGLERLEKSIPSLARDDPGKKLQGAVVVMQPRTGNILAMAGGRNYAESQFNRVTRARRQPGSCFKPIAVSAMLDRFKPSDILSNEKTTYMVGGNPWTPENFGEIPGKKLSVRDMLTLSCNRAAVDMVVRGGPEKVVEQAEEFNFSTRMRPYPSISLGAFEVTPLELARAYCAFAADGVQPFPLSVRDVADEDGNILVQRHMDINPVMSPAEAFLVTSMLKSAVTEGTASSLKEHGLDFPLAGKTGTTNEYRDAWFIGYTPDFLALVWVGFDNGAPVLATGSGAALPIFADLAKSMPGYISHKQFTIPPGVVKKKVCSQSGQKPAFMQCPDTYEEYFLETNQPEKKCDIHGPANVFKRTFDGVKDIFR